MKLRLRNYKTVTVLHITETVTTRDAHILEAGIATIVQKDTPLILDFERSFFKPGVAEALADLLEQLDQKEVEYYVVSKVLDSAHAESFAEALTLSENPNPKDILESIQLEAELSKLEDELAAIEASFSAKQKKGVSHENLKQEKEKMDLLKDVFDLITKNDLAKIESFQEQAAAKKVPPTDLRDLNKMKVEVLKILKEKGAIA